MYIFATCCRVFVFLIALVCSTAAVAQVCSGSVVDDHLIHIHNAQDVATARANLVQFIWNTPALPTDADLLITPSVASPFDCGGNNLDHVDQYNLDMGPGSNGTAIRGWAWYFKPTARNGRLVIVEDGHMPCDGPYTESGPQAFGFQMAVNSLVENGYDVLFVLMPLYVPDQCLADHSILFQPGYAPPTGNPMRYFFDTTLHAVNYLVSNNNYSDISMTGLSGGGWTTTLYSAIDPRVRLSFPVAGSIPLYLRGTVPDNDSPEYFLNGTPDAEPGEECNNYGDVEQELPALYDIAGYPDLYVLGSYGAGREQVQILNRNDSCCFGQAQEADSALYDSDQRTYEASVRAALQSLGSGTYRQEIDEVSIVHQISRNAFYNVIASGLDGLRPVIGAASGTNAFTRGSNGRLWQNTASTGWNDLGYRIVGTPSVAENAVHSLQLAARSTTNTPELMYNDGAQWHSQSLPTTSGDGSVVLPAGKIASDPVMQVDGAGELDIVAQGNDMSFYRWHVASSGITLDQPNGGANSVGIPGLSSIDGWLNITYRTGMVDDPETGCLEDPNVVYQLAQRGNGWVDLSRTSGSTRAYLAANNVDGASQSFLVGENAQVWNSDDGADQWSQITNKSNPFAGTPGAPIANANGYGLYIRYNDNNLAYVTNKAGVWSASQITLQSAEELADSPRDTPDGVYWLGADNQVRFRGGSGTNQVLNVVDTLFRDDMEGFISP